MKIVVRHFTMVSGCLKLLNSLCGLVIVPMFCIKLIILFKQLFLRSRVYSIESALTNGQEWQGLIVHQHLSQITPRHAQVLFTALFFENGKTQQHTELSTFVKMGETWFFIDPTVALPSMKALCFCGSGKKFKGCCGQFFK